MRAVLPRRTTARLFCWRINVLVAAQRPQYTHLRALIKEQSEMGQLDLIFSITFLANKTKASIWLHFFGCFFHLFPFPFFSPQHGSPTVTSAFWRLHFRQRVRPAFFSENKEAQQFRNLPRNSCFCASFFTVSEWLRVTSRIFVYDCFLFPPSLEEEKGTGGHSERRKEKRNDMALN